MEERRELLSEQVKAGKRTYFIDVYAAANGSKYVQITESRKKDDSHERSTIMVFEDDIVPFTKSLRKAAQFIVSDSV